MEMWELFLKGLAKTFEDFALKMIQKGQDEKSLEKPQRKTGLVHPEQQEIAIKSPVRRPSHPINHAVATPENIREIQEKIISVMMDHPQGITMKAIAAQLQVQWHFIRVPMRDLQESGKVLKNNLDYILPKPAHQLVYTKTESQSPGVEPSEKPVITEKAGSSGRTRKNHKAATTESAAKAGKAPVKSAETDTDNAFLHLVKPEPAATLHIIPGIEPVKEVEVKSDTAPRRRVVDASQLEDKPKLDPALENLSNKDRASMRYRLMTALRGRPEGLTLEKLSTVLGMESQQIIAIINELQAEKKIIKTDDNKFKQP